MVAGLVSGDKEAYDYLASSIAKFPDPDNFLNMMREAGFSKAYRRILTFGVASIYVGVK
jgi:demethylmenaquinone methyltransferase/2-methoxy-6-polyprenyl-1,4-benzoquinol methylase